MFFARIKRLLRTVGFRLTLLHSGLFALLSLVLLGLAFVLLKESVETREREQIDFRMTQFAEQYRRVGANGVIELCKTRKGRQQKAFFVRISRFATNETVFLRDADEWTEFRDLDLAPKMDLPPGERNWQEVVAKDDYVLVLSVLRFPDGVVLQVGKTTEDSRDLLNRFRYLAFLVMALLVPIGFVCAAFLSMRVLRPVRQLSETVVGILSTGRFDTRVPSRNTDDELDELVGLFNSLLGRIESLVRAMRESLDNVAHDLRTPMTRLRNGAQNTLENDGDIHATKDALADCVEESDRVLTILNTLMDISEAENKIIPLRCGDFELHVLLDDVVDLYREVAEEKGIHVGTDVPKDLTLNGDPTFIRRVVANLLDNAIKYTPAAGLVTIRAWRDSHGIGLSVKDNGVGIAANELPRIWERLYRGDKSRSARGLGLGLSFVRAITEAHGGTAEAHSSPGEGSTFVLRFPRPNPEEFRSAEPLQFRV